MRLSKPVAEVLNACHWSMAFKAVPRLFPLRDEKEFATLEVSTFDGPRTSDRHSRGEFTHTQTVWVTIQRKLAAEPSEQTAQVDGLVDLLVEIETYFEQMGDTVAGWTFTQFSDATDRNLFDVEIMSEISLFTSVIGLEFQD